MKRFGDPIRCFGLVVLLLLATYQMSCGRRGAETGAGGRETIQNAGSDTMVNLAQAWAEAYANVDTTVSVEVSGGGSGTGIAALINGTVDIANSSRKLKPEEFERARQNTGLEPIEFVVGYDALAVYVHPSNPLDRITLEELAEIYGEGGTITRWSQLGIQHKNCPSDEIIRVSRQSNSGTYFYFREAVLGENRDYKLGSRDLHGSKDVVELVTNTPCAIGYSGLGYHTDRVKMLKIARKKGDPYYDPSVEAVLNGTYPIARPLYMYCLGKPDEKEKRYLAWILSEEGQQIVIKSGYVPLPEHQRKATLARLEGTN